MDNTKDGTRAKVKANAGANAGGKASDGDGTFVFAYITAGAPEEARRIGRALVLIGEAAPLISAAFEGSPVERIAATTIDDACSRSPDEVEPAAITPPARSRA